MNVSHTVLGVNVDVHYKKYVGRQSSSRLSRVVQGLRYTSLVKPVGGGGCPRAEVYKPCQACGWGRLGNTMNQSCHICQRDLHVCTLLCGQ